jgi:hypothetical protein
MNSVSEIRKAILQLTPEQRAQLMTEVAPDLCRSVMQNPEIMAQVMPSCQETMMKNPDLMKAMRPMMERMMQSMTGGSGRQQ